MRPLAGNPMRAELIYNPSGGQVVIRRELGNVIAFLERCGWSVTLQETGRPGEATELARQAVAGGAEVVIAAGGDGTVNEVANGLVNTEAALGVLPVGTTNSWALQMGIPALNPMLPGTQAARLVAGLEELMPHPFPVNYYRKVLLDAARVLVEGRAVAVDVGEVSGRCFLISAGIGLEAAIIESISLREKRALGSWAYILTAIESALDYAGTEVSLNLDGRPERQHAPDRGQQYPALRRHDGDRAPRLRQRWQAGRLHLQGRGLLHLRAARPQGALSQAPQGPQGGVLPVPRDRRRDGASAARAC
jgi:diacylglycerol kinase family enzyme